MKQLTEEFIETLNLILPRMSTKDCVETLRAKTHEGFANLQAELGVRL
jgi:hypothetical protein